MIFIFSYEGRRELVLGDSFRHSRETKDARIHIYHPKVLPLYISIPIELPTRHLRTEYL